METCPLLSDTDTIRFRGGHQHISVAGGGGDESKRVGLVAIFVVTFDTKAGNMVEWQLPASCDLQGVEFKALASGAHNVHQDFTYFRMGSLYGLSCYERKSIKGGGADDSSRDGADGSSRGGADGSSRGGADDSVIKSVNVNIDVSIFGGLDGGRGGEEVKEDVVVVGRLIDIEDGDGEGMVGGNEGGCVDIGGIEITSDCVGDSGLRLEGNGGEVFRGDGVVKEMVGGGGGRERIGDKRIGGLWVDERGSRMRSVGVVCRSYEELSHHFKFLKAQVHWLLERPTDHKELEAYWLENREKEDEYVVRNIKSLHPSHTFADFVRHYGAKVFTLWKLVMCGARILIYSSPPIGDKCFHVHCMSHLSKHHHHRSLLHHPTPHPLFYINVADIAQLKQRNYIACTTEKIFQLKDHLYDVIVIDGEIVVANAAYRNIVKVNQSDTSKFEELLSYSRRDGYDDDDGDDDDVSYIEFFCDLNDRILSTLLDCAGREVGSKELKSLPLHSSLDRPFVLLLSEVYAIDVIVTLDNPCCPTSS